MNELAFNGYINLRGHQTWSKQWAGTGEPVLLLHGGLSATEDWDAYIVPAVEDRFRAYAYDRTAHGRTGSREGYYHFDFQRDEAIAYLEDVVGEPAHLVGYSDGGIIALMVAIARPDLVRSIVAIGTNFHYSGMAMEMNEDEITLSEEDVAEFAQRSPDPAEMQIEIIKKAFRVWRKEPNMTREELATISCPVLVLTGDDEPFTNHHTVDLYESLPNGRLAIIPAASHAVVKERTDLMNLMIRDFYDHPEYPITKYPRMRAERTAHIIASTEAHPERDQEQTEQ